MKGFADSHIHYRFLKFAEIENMLNTMSSLGVTDACLLALTYRAAAENLAGLYWKMKYDKMVMRAFGGLHITDRYSTIPYEIQAEKLLELGCDGIKIMQSPDMRKFLGFGVDDKKYEKLFSLLQEKSVPINMHVNDPRYFWDEGKDYHIGFPSYDQIYGEVITMLDRFPGLNITFPHFFFISDNPDEAVRLLEKYPNVHLDLTPGGEMFINFSKNPSYWHDFFTHFSDRLLFGTDSNSIKSINAKLNQMVYTALTSSADEFVIPSLYGRDWHLRGLYLDEQVINKICYDNYISFVGERKSVNEDLFYEYCEKMLNDIKTNPYDEYYIEGGELIPYFKDDPEQTVSTDFLERVLAEHSR